MNRQSIEKYYLERIPYPKDYEPTSWVKSVVGNIFVGDSWAISKVWICIGYDPGCGFWMENIEDSNELTNISERAIDKTWHKFYKGL